MASRKYPDIFPLALDSSSPPPICNTIHEGFPTPRYYLGWLLPQADTAKRFPRNPHKSPLPAVVNDAIAHKWPEVEPKYPVLKEKFKAFYPVAISSVWNCSRIIVVLCRNDNSRKKKLVEDHKEEVISLAMELIGLPEEMKAKMTQELKWHREKCKHDPYEPFAD